MTEPSLGAFRASSARKPKSTPSPSSYRKPRKRSETNWNPTGTLTKLAQLYRMCLSNRYPCRPSGSFWTFFGLFKTFPEVFGRTFRRGNHQSNTKPPIQTSKPRKEAPPCGASPHLAGAKSEVRRRLRGGGVHGGLHGGVDAGEGEDGEGQPHPGAGGWGLGVGLGVGGWEWWGRGGRGGRFGAGEVGLGVGGG